MNDIQDHEDFQIWPLSFALYVEAMLFSTHSSLHSAQRVADFLEGKKGTYTPEGVLDEVQNIVTHAAMLSRYFWPARDEPKGGPSKLHRKRGQYFRKRFKVATGNPLEGRELRNMIEHFDEKMDVAFQCGAVGHIFPAYVDPFPGEAEAPRYFFRAFFTDTLEFEILQKRYPLQPIVEELHRIHDLLTQFSVSGK